jgi:hypothetical protein
MRVYLGYSEMLSFNSWATLLSKLLGITVNYKELTVDKYNKRMTWHVGVGRELGEMYAYSAEFGFDGGEKNVMSIHDVSQYKACEEDVSELETKLNQILKTPPLSMEEYVKNEDWTSLFSSTN